MEGRKVIIRVADRGPGIGESAREMLFDPFFTTKSKGSGIGLAIAQRFVKGAGGSLDLLSREGGGTIAEVTLPVAQEADA